MQTTIPQSLYSAMRFNFLYVDKYGFSRKIISPIVCSALLPEAKLYLKSTQRRSQYTKMRSFTYRKERLCRAGR